MSESSQSTHDRRKGSFFDQTTIYPHHPDHSLSQEELSRILSEINFPQEIVGIDVNGTLITESDPTVRHIDAEDVPPLREAIAAVRAQGKAVILVSDSPGPQLVELGKALGTDEGAIGENGNMLVWGNNVIVINPLLGRDGIRSQIAEIASSLSFQKEEDRIAPEFPGGKFADPNSQEWAFGANRVATVSVLGPPSLITKLGKKLVTPAGTSVDCSPNDRFLGVHPGQDFKRNKGRTLGMLAGTGRSVTMIGNAPSDWTDPTTGVRSMFVGGSRMTDEMRKGAAYVSPSPLAKGVSDILKRV